MTRKNHPRFTTHLPMLCVLVLTLASPASATWKEKVLYSFQGGPHSGSVPAGGVVFDKQGNLYGVTSDGGGIYQLKPPTRKGGPWTERVLYVFQGNGKGDGATPEGGLVIDSTGDLYGTTAYGGTGNCVLLGSLVGCGTVFELSPPKEEGSSWKETILYSFPTAKQGYFPWGDLLFDGAGNLYGATQFGGAEGTTCDKFYGGECGAVFELSPPKTKGRKWTKKVLHSFAGIGTGKQYGDGANPNGGLVLDSEGAIYGTSRTGGYNCPHSSNEGCGTAFKLLPPAEGKGTWTEKILYRFNGTPDGGEPAAGMLFGEKGTLFGTTEGGGGGNNGNGTVFELVRGVDGKWTESQLHSFQFQNDGALPLAGLILDASGNLYGTASAGGADGGGTLFRLRRTSTGWTFVVLYAFTADDFLPDSALILDATRTLYGTTQDGGTGQGCGTYGCGTVFAVSP
jgi:uncharacterized repeat protein (TIGR03803 family)